jgi:hypothetical protein
VFGGTNHYLRGKESTGDEAALVQPLGV